MPRLPPSVLHVSQPTTEGVARCVANIAAAQRARGWEVAVACPRSGWLAETIEVAGARHLDWPAGRAPGPSVAAEVERLSRAISAAAPDVVHLHSSKAGLAGRLAIRGRRPTLFQPHAWSFEVGGALAAPARAWERWAARWTRLLVCCGRAELETGRRAGVRVEAEVVVNSIDVGAYRVMGPEDRLAARARLGLPDEPLVVCVGRLSAQKGQDLLLDAWPAVRRAVPDAAVALVGDGPDRERLAARREPGVRLVGARDDVADWLAAADVVAVPSRYDCPSLAMLEAMACGRTVVAHDVGGLAEVFAAANGLVAGALVPLGDREALAGAVVARLRDPDLAATEGEAGRQLVERNHDLAGWAERLCAITERVAAA